MSKKNRQIAEASSPVTPPPTKLCSAVRSFQRKNKRAFLEEPRERIALPLLPEEIWIAILRKLAITDPESVVVFGCCCTHANNIMTYVFAGTLSMETVYPKVAWMKNLLSSVERWWRVHRNAEAGVQLGVLHGWYSDRPDTGLVILNEVIDTKNDPQAIYAANLLYRTKRCAAKPLKDMSIFFYRGTHADLLDKCYDNLYKMLSAHAIRYFRRRDEQLDGPLCEQHSHVPFWQLQCCSCVVDREADDVFTPGRRFPLYEWQLLDIWGYELNDLYLQCFG